VERAAKTETELIMTYLAREVPEVLEGLFEGLDGLMV
jgi:hypothetical protein